MLAGLQQSAAPLPLQKLINVGSGGTAAAVAARRSDVPEREPRNQSSNLSSSVDPAVFESGRIRTGVLEFSSVCRGVMSDVLSRLLSSSETHVEISVTPSG